jgi:hypothetical protein
VTPSEIIGGRRKGRRLLLQIGGKKILFPISTAGQIGWKKFRKSWEK